MTTRYGFWRRIRLVPFTRRFPLDASLAGQLQAEAPGILAWAVRGALEWQADGLTAPPIVMNAVEAWEADSDPLKDFLNEACDVTNPKVEVNATVIYKAYKAWAERQELGERERLSLTAFGRKLGERYEKYRDKKKGVFYVGITLNSDS